MRKFNFRKMIALVVNKINSALESSAKAASNTALKFGLVGKGSSQKLVVTFEVTTARISNVMNAALSSAYTTVESTMPDTAHDRTFQSGILYCLSTIAKIMEECDEEYIKNLFAIGSVQFEAMFEKYSDEEYADMDSERKARIMVEELSNLLLIMEKPDRQAMM